MNFTQMPRSLLITETYYLQSKEKKSDHITKRNTMRVDPWIKNRRDRRKKRLAKETIDGVKESRLFREKDPCLNITIINLKAMFR